MKLKNGRFPVKASSWIWLAVVACGADNNITTRIQFDQAESRGLIENTAIREASGLTAAISNPEMLWTHNDSGNDPVIYLMDEYGRHKAQFYLKGIYNRDWEDIASGPGPRENKNYIYIAETGDNNAVYDCKFIYRFEEPAADDSVVVDDIQTIAFVYPDGKRDAECLMIDPLTKDLFIISKREEQVGLYRLPYPQPVGDTVTIDKLGVIPFHNTVAGDISADGKWILLKTYENIFLWPRTKNMNMLETLLSPPLEIPYSPEPQGEAIAWKRDGSGFFTLSEEPAGIEAVLYFYSAR